MGEIAKQLTKALTKYRVINGKPAKEILINNEVLDQLITETSWFPNIEAAINGEAPIKFRGVPLIPSDLTERYILKDYLPEVNNENN